LTFASSQDKENVRQAAFKRRLALDAEDRRKWSAQVRENFLKHVELPPAGSVITAYAPVNGEVDVMPLITHLHHQGYRCAMPYVMETLQRLAFLEWTPETTMYTGLYGIPQPDPQKAHEVLPDFLIVPMLAFDAQCHRMGYGSGQFDRTFADLKKIQTFRTVGIAFEAQKFDPVPVDMHDYTLDMVVTESHVYRKQKE
jgi:5-formyltetrahydrofolate cyclo-ligase